MILDSRNEFCDAVAINTGAAGTYLVGSQIDASLATSSTTPGVIGAIDDLYLVISVDTAFTGGIGGKVSFSLASDASAAIATDGTATVHYTTAIFDTAAGVPAGTVLAVVELPKGAYERYLGILQTTITAAATAGKINAFLTADPAYWKSFDAPFQL